MPIFSQKNDKADVESVNENLEVDSLSIFPQVQVPALAWAYRRWEVKKKPWRLQTGKYQALVAYDGTLW